ncbi:E3 ubiquitin-protein ligase TRIM39-like [Labrus bergylta]|uniref:E3 ubiquitin-protein ligase TRIM39-like n=1 Tax=Labrus bergylta TaxID=56723 RepID=UPI0033136931
MSAASCMLSEEQFLCSICLDVFTDPVSIPCGHNFCKSCITHHWDVNAPCQCPLCSKVFNRRPELHVNTFISEMAAQFRHSSVKKSSRMSLKKHTNSGEVLCDVCTESKMKALKSCLVCLTSYCETHLEPHHRIPGLKRHELIDPVENLEDRICKSHGRPLEMFCKTDQRCVCQFCTESEHKQHVFVPMMEEYKVKRDKLVKLDAEIQQKIQKRRVKIEKIRQSVKLSREDTDRETAASMQVFTALIRSVEEGLAQLLDLLEEEHNKTEKQAEGFIKELEDEISELMKRSAEVEQLSRTEDHLQFLQNLPSLNPAPPTHIWTEVRVHSSHEGTVRSAVAQLAGTLNEKMRKMCADVELKRVQQYAVDVTLDPDTANPYLILSDDQKRVKSVETQQILPDYPQRFTTCNGVLGKQSFSSGRSYYEVLVKEKTDWDVGVAGESIIRKGKVTLSPKNGFWTVWLRNGKDYKALAGPGVLLVLKSKPQKVGVFVDYEGGVVSFYDADAAALIYSFTGCNFTEKLYPYFSPCSVCGGANAAPLILPPLTTQSLI